MDRFTCRHLCSEVDKLHLRCASLSIVHPQELFVPSNCRHYTQRVQNNLNHKHSRYLLLRRHNSVHLYFLSSFNDRFASNRTVLFTICFPHRSSQWITLKLNLLFQLIWMARRVKRQIDHRLRERGIHADCCCFCCCCRFFRWIIILCCDNTRSLSLFHIHTHALVSSGEITWVKVNGSHSFILFLLNMRRIKVDLILIHVYPNLLHESCFRLQDGEGEREKGKTTKSNPLSPARCNACK